MNKKIITLIIIVVVLLIGFIFFFGGKTYKLSLPEKNKIVSINLEGKNQLKYISDKDTINKIYNIISNNNKTKTKSTTDSPVEPDSLIKIGINYEEEIATIIYIYHKNNKYYMEQPYNGIYKIENNDFSTIEELMQ